MGNNNKAGIILAAVMVVVLGAGILFTVNSSNKAETAEQTQVEQLAQTRIEFIQASLDVVYAQQRSYPLTTETLLEYTKEGTRENLKTAIESLENYDYKLRGDAQAYEISYTVGGEKKTVKGEYSKELR